MKRRRGDNDEYADDVEMTRRQHIVRATRPVVISLVAAIVAVEAVEDDNETKRTAGMRCRDRQSTSTSDAADPWLSGGDVGRIGD